VKPCWCFTASKQTPAARGGSTEATPWGVCSCCENISTYTCKGTESGSTLSSLGTTSNTAAVAGMARNARPQTCSGHWSVLASAATHLPWNVGLFQLDYHKIRKLSCTNMSLQCGQSLSWDGRSVPELARNSAFSPPHLAV